jgi:hypothetical protein
MDWGAAAVSMIRKKPAADLIRGGSRFSEKIMLKQNARRGMTIRRKVIPFWRLC